GLVGEVGVVETGDVEHERVGGVDCAGIEAEPSIDLTAASPSFPEVVAGEQAVERRDGAVADPDKRMDDARLRGRLAEEPDKRRDAVRRDQALHAALPALAAALGAEDAGAAGGGE